MPQLCPRCKRANPEDAVYCYFDGFVLQQGAVVSPHGQLSREFLFTTSGKRCRTIDEIAQTCQAEWNEAREMLRRGEFERFFGQAGRLDLARCAQEAQTNPDADVALLQFVSNLPVSLNPAAPRLDLTPRRIALGSVKAGEQKQIKLTVINSGKGLLQGKVAVSDGDPWLKLADGIDPKTCPIKAATDQDLTVRVDSRGLVAGQRYSGKLTVVTNGGIAEVPLRLDMVAVPFPRPPFQGAASPRAMAERMRTNPKQAVPLLENGEVQRWFEANGWKYPVPGTPARGVGAVQQFFECLGLSKAPPVMLSENELRFDVAAPAVVQGQVVLRTTTKKWVYAQVESSVPWLRPTKPSVSGPQHATIGFEIDSGQMEGRAEQEAILRVIANGGQRLMVRVRVNVQFPRGFVPAVPPRHDPAASTMQMSGQAMFTPAVVASMPTPVSRPIAPPPIVPMQAALDNETITWAPTPVQAPPSLDWLPPTVEKPRRPESLGVRFLRPLFAGIVAALMLRMVLAAPAEILARVVLSRGGNPVPGSLDCWKHSPLERKEDGTVREEHFLKWFVISTWWVGGIAGGWLTWRRGGRPSDLLFGTIAGAAGGLPAAATAGCVMVVIDGFPRAVLVVLSRSGSEMSTVAATALWLALVALCWAALGAGFGYLLCAFGRGGAKGLTMMVSPIAALCRACGLRGIAELLGPE